MRRGSSASLSSSRHRGPPLEQLEQPLAGLELGASCVAEQPGRPADVQPRALLGSDIAEGGPNPLEERLLGRREPLVGEASPERARAQPEPDDAFVQVLVRPRRETGVDRIVVFEDALRDAAAGRDHHDHHRAWLEHENLDVADSRGVE